MKRLILLALLTLLLTPACRPPETGTRRASGADAQRQVTVTLPEGPRLGNAPVLVEIRDGGQPFSGASVRITGDMTHAGMVPVIVQAQEQASGRYVAEDFAFSMAGDWILTVDIGYPEGGREMSELRVTVPGG
ncbi:MAG: FixH family protein [Deinococcota bacterium]|nr:FixH family protein [Deinococcota bacterium]